MYSFKMYLFSPFFQEVKRMKSVLLLSAVSAAYGKALKKTINKTESLLIVCNIVFKYYCSHSIDNIQNARA